MPTIPLVPKPRLNALDQALDIAGSLNQLSNLTISDEPLGYGAPIAGVSGTTAVVATFNSPIATITGLVNIPTDGYIGNFITFSGAVAQTGNNGTFLIVAYNSATSVDILNPSAVVHVEQLTWQARSPYTLLDDMNYARADRTLIKGVEYHAAVPTYTRPTATTTNIPANLSNIATKTTDARGFILTRAFFDGYATYGTSEMLLSATGLLTHSTLTDRTGVPVFDDPTSGPYLNVWKDCFVDINDGYNGTELVVQAGAHAGERIFGIAYAAGSSSPDSVTVKFYSCPIGADIALHSTAYTWENLPMYIPNKVSLFYGYFQRLDQLPDDAFRTIVSLGMSSDGYVLANIDNILTTLGTTHGDTSLSGYLTNLTAYYPFFNLSDATPSVVEALNTLNTQIGDRTYPVGTLTSGQTITASLIALAGAITGSIVRTIERLSADVDANTAHTLPAGAQGYSLDGTNNGHNLWVFTRGVLRDPGPVSDGNDYAETSGTQITFYSKQKNNDHINYFKKA